MSYIPDCRTDENYNQKYLDESRKKELAGFDWCAEEVVDNFFDNEMNGLEYGDLYLGHVLAEEVPEYMQEEYTMEFSCRDDEDRTIKTYADLIRFKLLEWIESGRNKMIVSMIENMSEDEYTANKEKANGQVESEER